MWAQPWPGYTLWHNHDVHSTTTTVTRWAQNGLSLICIGVRMMFSYHKSILLRFLQAYVWLDIRLSGTAQPWPVVRAQPAVAKFFPCDDGHSPDSISHPMDSIEQQNTILLNCFLLQLFSMEVTIHAKIEFTNYNIERSHNMKDLQMWVYI